MKKIFLLFSVLLLTSLSPLMVNADTLTYKVSCVANSDGSLVSADASIEENKTYQIVTKEFNNTSEYSNFACVSKMNSLTCSSSKTDTNDATADASEILSGSTAYVKGNKVFGTMPKIESKTITLKAGETYTIPKGYHDGTGVVKVACENCIDTSTSYIGYYADIDGDGTVDGVIFADLAFSKSGQWGVERFYSYFSYSSQDDLKHYYISQESYEGKFGTAAVISPVSGTIDNDRFYVMALSDLSSSTCNWYKNASIPNPNVVTWAFGKGKENLVDITKAWNNSKYGKQDDNDLWGIIQTYAADGWFVPSKSEWVAFLSEFIKPYENFNKYGLSQSYWSSSNNGSKAAFVIKTNSYYIDDQSFSGESYVRLATMF